MIVGNPQILFPTWLANTITYEGFSVKRGSPYHPPKKPPSILNFHEEPTDIQTILNQTLIKPQAHTPKLSTLLLNSSTFSPEPFPISPIAHFRLRRTRLSEVGPAAHNISLPGSAGIRLGFRVQGLGFRTSGCTSWWLGEGNIILLFSHIFSYSLRIPSKFGPGLGV